MAEAEDDWGDDDDGFGDDGDDDWGEAIEDDGFVATRPEDIKPEDREEREEQIAWKCDECKHQNPGGLLCLGCGEPDLGALDREKRKMQLKECTFWSGHYTDCLLPLRMHVKSGGELLLDRDPILKIIREIYAHEALDMRWPDFRKWADSDAKPSCDSCLAPFATASDSVSSAEDADEKMSASGSVVREELTCHCNICRVCFKSWIQQQIAEEQVVPHIRCPAEDCECSIPFGNFVDHFKLSTKTLYTFASIYCEKMLARNSNWIQCPTGKCKYGVMFGMAEDEKVVTCDACDTTHTLKRKEEQDEGFKKMVADGLIRFCPVCEHPHMKDYGLCNVLQCESCNSWWNWRTKEHAKTCKELKAKARREHTLWEPGELDYQRKLQTEDLPAFIELLARNGIKYDPHFRRGQS